MNRYRRGLVLLIILLLAVLLYFDFTRQFVKMTVLFALPLALLLSLKNRLPRGSIGHTLIAAGMVVIIVVYGLQLYKLPVKARVWDLAEKGAVLMAAGRYEEARQVYQQIGELGDERTMQKKLAALQEEEKYAHKVKKAQELISAGHKEAARALLKSIPATSGSYQKARMLLKKLE